MSAKLTSDSVKQGFSVPASLLENARRRAAELHGGNLSRYLQSLIEQDLTGGPKSGGTEQPVRPNTILADLAAKWRPDVAADVAAAATKCQRQERLLGMMLAAIPHFVAAWEKDHPTHPIPPDDFNGLYLIPDYSANELRDFLDRNLNPYDRLFNTVKNRMTPEELGAEENIHVMEMTLFGGNENAALYLPKMRSGFAPDALLDPDTAAINAAFENQSKAAAPKKKKK